LVVLDAGNRTHRAVFEHFRELANPFLAPESAVEIRSLDLSRQKTQETPEAGLIITIGVRAAAELQNHPADVPVLNVLIPQDAYRQLIAAARRETAAVFLDQPVERQFAVAHALLPTVHAAGMLLGSESSADIASFSRAAGRFSLRLDIVTVDRGANPASAIRQLLTNNEVIVSTFDREAYQPATAKWLLYLALRQRRPIIGFSYALLEAGAVATVFSTPEDIARQTAGIVAAWVHTGVAPTGTAFPRYYNIGINARIAEKLGLNAPSEKVLEKRVRTLLGETP
jgi:ABC-type uncharacterized transport system substrate-binding protein